MQFHSYIPCFRDTHYFHLQVSSLKIEAEYFSKILTTHMVSHQKTTI